MIEPQNRAAETILSYAAKKKRKDLLAYLGMAESTFLSRIHNPGKFTLTEMTALQRFLHIPDEVIISIIKNAA